MIRYTLLPPASPADEASWEAAAWQEAQLAARALIFTCTSSMPEGAPHD